MKDKITLDIEWPMSDVSLLASVRTLELHYVDILPFI